MQNGHRGDARNNVAPSSGDGVVSARMGGADSRRDMRDMILDVTAEIFGEPDEVRAGSGMAYSAAAAPGGSEAGSRRNHPAGLPGDASAPGGSGQAELEAARRHAESLSVQAHADAEELLSRARSHADLLRVHAEAARAEAECLRAEAATLRAAVRDEAAAASSRAESLTAQAHAAAEELRSAIEGEADAARAEVEQLRTEAASLRRLLQAEIGAGLAEAQQMRAEVQRLWAETNTLAANLGLRSARAGAAGALKVLGGDTTTGGEEHPPPPPATHRDDFPRTIAPDDEDHGHGGPTGADGAVEAPSGDQPVDGHEDRPRGWQPLIGSGGWHAGTAPTPDAMPAGEPVGPDEMPPPASGGRRSFRRRR